MRNLKDRLVVLQASETSIKEALKKDGKSEAEIQKILKETGIEDQIAQTNLAISQERTAIFTTIATIAVPVITASSSIICATMQTRQSSANLDKVLAFEATGECIGTKAWSSVSKAI